jgi:hypothetical protein
VTEDAASDPDPRIPVSNPSLKKLTGSLIWPPPLPRAALSSGRVVSGGTVGAFLRMSRSIMMQISLREWQIASVATGVALAAGTALWLFSRKRPTADDLERERRQMLLNYGRIVDGMLLDGFQVTVEDSTGTKTVRDMLLYQYEISGVTYECSQDITPLSEILDPAKVKLGLPGSIRYQPGIPENSILVSERWSGLRDGVPVMWIAPQDRPDRNPQTDSSH